MKSITKFYKSKDEESDDLEIDMDYFEDNEVINDRFDTFFEVSERSESKNKWYR